MSNRISIGIGVALVFGLIASASPALASLELLAVVTKDKDVTVDINVDITKNIDINVVLDVVLEGAAEADALANVSNVGNTVGPCEESCANGPNGIDFGIELSALMDTSVNDNEGIVNVNQDVGNMVNQGNLLAFSRVEFTGGTVEDPSQIVSDAQAEVDQVNSLNSALQEEIFAEPVFSDPDHDATISGSIQGNNGVVGVNQNSGNMNNQTNAVAMVIGEGNAIVLTEAALGQVNSENSVEGVETVKVDLITGSINSNSGVVSVNQSSGNMNNQGSAIAFGALKTSATVGVPGT